MPEEQRVTRRDSLGALAAAPAALHLQQGAAAGALRADGRKPNVVLIVSDDQGYADLSCYDHPPEVSTPHHRPAGAGGCATDRRVRQCLGLRADKGRLAYRAAPATIRVLRDCKHSPYEGGIRVPFLVRWPDMVPAGTVCEEPIICLDITPS